LRDNRLSRCNTISECDGQTDGQTEMIYQYHAVHSYAMLARNKNINRYN